MSKFTRGPWKQSVVPAFGSGVHRMRGPSDVDVAQILKPRGMTIATYEANRFLIETAPDMYVLILKAHKDLCGCQTMGEDCGWPDARDIIAKVEQYGRNTQAGVWISRETADEIAKDGP